jgi:phosphohistidine phosphatase
MYHKEMRTLYLLRHAKSAWDDPALDDHERPLAPRGRKASRLLARHFRERDADPELVLCSTAQRTRETLDIVLAGFAATPLIATERGLYLAGAESMLERLRDIEAGVQRAMIIGHNPGLHELAVTLAQKGPARLTSALARKFPTGALATFAVETPWAELDPGDCRLDAFIIPAELEAG